MASDTIMASVVCQVASCRGYVQGKVKCKVQVKKLKLNWSLPCWSIAPRINLRTPAYETATIEPEVTMFTDVHLSSIRYSKAVT